MASIPPGTDLCTIPAGNPPNGQPNFKNPPTLAPMTFSVSLILLSISVTLTVGRIYIRRRKLGAADYCTLIACLFNIAFTGVIVAQHKYNRHQWDIPVCWFTGSYFKILYVQTTIFAPSFWASKAAIFLLYRQIFGVNARIRTAIYVGLIFTTLLYLPNIPLSAALETPGAGHPWVSMLTNHKSSRMTIWGIVQSSLSILLDLYIFILPLPIILKLNISFGRRLQIAAVFATALIGIVASVLSLAYRIKLLRTTDALWWTSIVSVCGLIETNVAIIVSCTPAWAKILNVYVIETTFFQSLWSRIFSSSSGSDGDPSKDGNKDERSKVHTIGSMKQPRRRNYHELTDSALLRTQNSASELEPQEPVYHPNDMIHRVESSEQPGGDRTERM